MRFVKKEFLFTRAIQLLLVNVSRVGAYLQSTVYTLKLQLKIHSSQIYHQS